MTKMGTATAVPIFHCATASGSAALRSCMRTTLEVFSDADASIRAVHQPTTTRLRPAALARYIA